jgi:hypothetical protein
MDNYIEVQRDVLKTEKKAVIAESIQFTDNKSAVFWQLYNEYNEKMYVLNTKLYKLIQNTPNTVVIR